MEAQGPTARRGNSLRPESGAGFDLARNLHSNTGAAISLDGGATGAGGNDASNPSQPPATASNIGLALRTARLAISPRGALVNELIGMIGIDGVARLIATFGGLRLYVPHEPEPGDALSETVGYEAALTLAKGYGGDRIEVPNPTPRGRQIIELRANGVSIDDIARSQHCTVRRVYQVLAEARRKQLPRAVPQPQ